MKPKLQVLDQDIATNTKDGVEYICITDIAKHKSPDRAGVIIGNWLRNRNTIEFLGIWEQLNNPEFKVIEFDDFKKQAGLNSFTLTPKQWIAKQRVCLKPKRLVKLNELTIRHMGILLKTQISVSLGCGKVSNELYPNQTHSHQRPSIDDICRYGAHRC